jgi:hypothetical protein
MRLLSGFFRTKPLIISSIPDIQIISFVEHYVQAAVVSLPYACWRQVAKDALPF